MDINWIVTPIVGAIVGLGVWFVQSRIEALRREQERLHDDRRKVYADVLEPFIRLFAGVKNPKEMQKALEHVQSFNYKRTAFEFTLLGADEVVKSFNKMMQYIYSISDSQQPDAAKMMELWGTFLLEIRRNVGNPKTKLMATDMLSSQIKDIHKMIKAS